MDITVLGTIVILQFIYIAYTEKMHQRERIDLYNRIMSRNIGDYKDLVVDKAAGKPRNFIKKRNDELREYLVGSEE